MPRTRKKTEADRPTYRPTRPPLSVPEDLEPFLEGVELRRIVEKYGAVNIQLVVEMIAEQARRELIDRRSRENLDAWKANMRPLAAATTAGLESLDTSDARRRAVRYRRHREEEVDVRIREQVRVRQLEDGLSIILEREPDSWERRRLVEFVDGVRAGKPVAQIALEAKVSAATVESGLREVRNARVAAEAEQLANPSPHNELNDGRGTKTPVLIEGENNRRASP
jgi:hypothetical protein